MYVINTKRLTHEGAAWWWHGLLIVNRSTRRLGPDIAPGLFVLAPLLDHSRQTMSVSASLVGFCRPLRYLRFDPPSGRKTGGYRTGRLRPRLRSVRAVALSAHGHPRSFIDTRPIFICADSRSP